MLDQMKYTKEQTKKHTEWCQEAQMSSVPLNKLQGDANLFCVRNVENVVRAE